MPDSVEPAGAARSSRRPLRLSLRRRGGRPASEEETFAVPLFENGATDVWERDVDRRDRQERRAAITSVRLVASALALVAVAAVAVVVTGRLAIDRDTPESVGLPEADPGASAIGPAEGVDIDQYVARRRADLASASGDRVAVLSLIRYEDPATVEALVQEIEQETGFALEVGARLVAVPGAGPEVVTGEFAEWMAAERAEVERERTEIERLLPTVEEGSEFADFYRSEVERLTAVLAALEPTGDVVFGLLVRGDAGALRHLAEQGEVRLVDVAPSTALVPDALIRGIRPEEVRTTGDPAARPEPIT